jgi:hypothetical protein
LPEQLPALGLVARPAKKLAVDKALHAEQLLAHQRVALQIMMRSDQRPKARPFRFLIPREPDFEPVEKFLLRDGGRANAWL